MSKIIKVIDGCAGCDHSHTYCRDERNGVKPECIRMCEVEVDNPQILTCAEESKFWHGPIPEWCPLEDYKK